MCLAAFLCNVFPRSNDNGYICIDETLLVPTYTFFSGIFKDNG